MRFAFWKKPETKTFDPTGLVKELKDHTERLDDLIYAFVSLDVNHRLPEPFRTQAMDFANKANFGVSSFHDTVKLGYEALGRERRMNEKRRVSSASENVLLPSQANPSPEPAS